MSAGTGSDSVRGSDSPAKDEIKTLIVSMVGCVMSRKGRDGGALEDADLSVNEMRRRKVQPVSA